MTKKIEKNENTDAKKSKKSTMKSREQELKDEVNNLSTEIKRIKEKLIRCYADFDNYKKRILKENDSSIFKIKKNYLLELLDIKELILKALDDNDPKDGLRIVLKQLEKFFESEKIKYIECIEKPFDHKYHHAVITVEKPDFEDNMVIEEIKKGYLVEDNVLRPSHVVVSKKKCEEDQ